MGWGGSAEEVVRGLVGQHGKMVLSLENGHFSPFLVIFCYMFNGSKTGNRAHSSYSLYTVKATEAK